MGPGWGQLTAEESSLCELQEQDKGASRAPPPTPTANSLPHSLPHSFNKYLLSRDSGARLPGVKARLHHLLPVRPQPLRASVSLGGKWDSVNPMSGTEWAPQKDWLLPPLPHYFYYYFYYWSGTESGRKATHSPHLRGAHSLVEFRKGSSWAQVCTEGSFEKRHARPPDHYPPVPSSLCRLLLTQKASPPVNEPEARHRVMGREGPGPKTRVQVQLDC